MRRIPAFFGAFLICAGVLALLNQASLGTVFMAPAAAQTGSARAENIVVSTSTLTFKIKSISVSGTSLTNSDLAALFDPKSSQAIPDRLKQLSAATILIPEFIVEINNGVHETLTYRDIRLEGVTSGLATKVTAAEADFTVKTASSHVTSGAYGKVTVDAFDLGLAAAIMTGARDGQAQQKQPLYDAFTIEGLTLAEPKSEFALSVKRLSGHAMKARPFAISVPALPEEKDKSAQKQLSYSLSEPFNAFDIGDLQAEGLRVNAHGNAGPIIAVVDQVQIHDITGGTLAEIAIHNLALQAKTVTARCDALVMHGIDLQDMRKAIAGQIADKGAAASELPMQSLALFTTPESMLINGLSVTITDPATDHQPPNSLSFTIAHFESNGSALTGSTTLDHLIFEPQPAVNGALFETLAELGYSKVDLSAHVTTAFNSSNELNISDFTLNGSDMGKFQSSLRADHLSHDVLSQDQAVSEAALRAALFKHLEFRLDNEGLVEKIISRQAADQHKTIEEMRDTYIAAAGIVPVLLGNSPASKDIGAALAKFIAKPKSFHLILAAPLGLSAEDLSLLQEPAALLQKINVEVSANP